MELKPIQHSLVGMPGGSGLSVEQRKRLTIAVELVTSPSIMMMDEPTSGCCAVMYHHSTALCLAWWVGGSIVDCTKQHVTVIMH